MLHWRKSWRDDIDKTDTNIPKTRLGGIVIGYTDYNNELIGVNSMRSYDTDRITENTGPGWAVVKWNNGITTVYRATTCI